MKIKYYGYSVNVLTGEVADLKVLEVPENDYIPLYESVGFSYAKRFTNYQEFIKSKKYVIEYIKKKRS